MDIWSGSRHSECGRGGGGFSTLDPREEQLVPWTAWWVARRTLRGPQSNNLLGAPFPPTIASGSYLEEAAWDRIWLEKWTCVGTGPGVLLQDDSEEGSCWE
ncbi:hypothetical protein NDU88_000127 [Pleurodeles waltl]|uniref:Uncharacterized protein n=1 Tax=Pleurodeles waltl TaxID=8319 RepID=A0AAV7MGV5_PLEWA|nr:hypothetical protein NDU88_000127 [Pleurodeles waltl]